MRTFRLIGLGAVRGRSDDAAHPASWARAVRTASRTEGGQRHMKRAPWLWRLRGPTAILKALSDHPCKGFHLGWNCPSITSKGD